MSLPPYSGRNADCPKCEYPVLKVDWHEYGGQRGAHTAFLCAGLHGLGEHVCRTCPACGFDRVEATADADGEP